MRRLTGRSSPAPRRPWPGIRTGREPFRRACLFHSAQTRQQRVVKYRLVEIMGAYVLQIDGDQQGTAAAAWCIANLMSFSITPRAPDQRFQGSQAAGPDSRKREASNLSGGPARDFENQKRCEP